MAKNKYRNRLFHRPVRWQLFASIILLIYPLFRAINSHVHPNTDTLVIQMDLHALASMLMSVVAEFGALVVLFGLCVFTLYIGLRMVLHPVVGWGEN